MKINIRIQTVLLSALSLTLILLTVLFLGTSNLNTPIRQKIVQLDDGWTVLRGNETYQIDSIYNSDVGVVNYNDTITLTRILPNVNISPASIHMRSILSTMDVYLDDELIYSFGKHYVRENEMIPKMQNFVPLPDGYQGKTIKIVISPQEEDAFSGLPAITLGTYDDLTTNMLQTMRLPLAIGAFLCMLGMILAIISPFLLFTEFHDYSIFFGAITSLIMGTYVLCYNDLIWYICDRPALYTFIEYLDLFLIPASIIGFITAAHQIPQLRLGYSLMTLNLGFALITTLMHVTNLSHICHFVPILHVMAIIEGGFVIFNLGYSCYKRMHDKDTPMPSILSTNILMLGLICFLLCSLIDIVKFNIQKYIGNGEVNANINFMTVGAFLFMMCLLLNYFFHCIEFINESYIKRELEGIAYTDTLTGLSNRTRCELTLAELKGEYTIISLDLDYLKYTNDNFGHGEGDRLLSGFSDMLKDSFTDASLVGRMGGDEFIVILPFIDDERTNRDMSCLSDLMTYRNSKETTIRFSASWGYADSMSDELKGDTRAQSVYLLADKRMYSMKKSHHNQKFDRLCDDLLSHILYKGGGLKNEN